MKSEASTRGAVGPDDVRSWCSQCVERLHGFETLDGNAVGMFSLSSEKRAPATKLSMLRG